MPIQSNYDFWGILTTICNDSQYFIDKVINSRFSLNDYLKVRFELSEGEIKWLRYWINKHDEKIISYLEESE